jgi:hypothetical protein
LLQRRPNKSRSGAGGFTPPAPNPYILLNLTNI